MIKFNLCSGRMIAALFICMFTTSFSFFNQAVAQPGTTTWTARSYPVENNWIAVAFGNGTFVATASSGTGNRVMTSPDGITWTARTTPADNVWASVAYGGGLFVAVGAPSASTNTVMTSPDGITWTLRASVDVTSQWVAVAYGNGRFVALAQSGTIRSMTSTDGINWTAGTGVPAATWTGVTYGNGVYVGVSLSGTDPVVTSPDGINWTVRTAGGNSNWNGVAYGNNLFVAVRSAGTGQRVMTSPDGTTWTLQNTPADNSWRAIRYDNGLFVSIAISGTGNRIMTSPNGTTWTARSSTADNQWRGLAYGNGMWVATAITGGAGTRLMTSGTPTLPVSWVSFTGKTSASGNILQWQTATEMNNNHFEIERSVDGRTFSVIGKINAATNAENGASYTYADAIPPSGTSYYRLKQVDRDGQFDYSKTITISNAAALSFIVYPNPSTGTITLRGISQNTAPLNYIITNTAGRTAQSGVVPSNATIDIHALPKGQYMIVVGEKSQQFVKL
jgi:hypothetical protein